MNKTSLKSKKLAKVLFAILFGATILTGCENNISESDKTIDNPSGPSVVEVVKEEINSVSITKMPTKTQYEVGDKFDATGLEVNVNKTTSYSDNTTKTSDVSVKYVDEKDSFEFIFDSHKKSTNKSTFLNYLIYGRESFISKNHRFVNAFHPVCIKILFIAEHRPNNFCHFSGSSHN